MTDVRRRTWTGEAEGLVETLGRRVDPDVAVPRGAVNAFIAESEQHNAEIPAELYNAVPVFDEYLLWMVQLGTALIYEGGELTG